MARRYRPRSRFLLPLLIAVVGLVLYYTDDINQSTLLIKKAGENQPTAFAEGTHLVEYGDDGSPKLDVRSVRSIYFDDAQLVLTELPEIHFTNEQGDSAVLKAKQGEYRPSQQTLELIDDVELQRQDATGTTLTLNTENLLVDLDKNFISSSQEVTIEQNRHKLSSLGIKASLNDKKLVLPARVRGVYDLSE